MSHGDKVSIILPMDTEVTITEDNQGYDTTFKKGDEEAESVDSVTVTMTDNIDLLVTNTLNGLIPTGVYVGLIPFAAIAVVIVSAIVVLVLRQRSRYEE